MRWCTEHRNYVEHTDGHPLDLAIITGTKIALLGSAGVLPFRGAKAHGGQFFNPAPL